VLITTTLVQTIARSEEDVDVKAVIEGRQANLRDLGAAFKAITDELKKP